MRHYLEDMLDAFIKDRTLAEVGRFTCTTRWGDGINIDFTEDKHELLRVSFLGEKFLVFITVKDAHQADSCPMWVVLCDDYCIDSKNSLLVTGMGLLKLHNIKANSNPNATSDALCHLYEMIGCTEEMYMRKAKEMRTIAKELVKMSKVLKRKRKVLIRSTTHD